jgi:hypothetical protein
VSYRVSQAAFARALLDPAFEVSPGLASKAGSVACRRFAIYRNNVVVSLVDALAAHFPVTQELVGEEFFRAMARCYVQENPPQRRVIPEYGDTFPDFIASFEPVATVSYLGDLARLEALRTQAYHAADATPLAHAALECLLEEDLLTVRFGFHPSHRILQSRYAVASLWAAHQGLGNLADVDPHVPEDMLILRPDLEVEVMRLPPGAAIFFTRLAQGEILGGAVLDATQTTTDFDLAQAMGLLVTSGVVISVLA